MLVSNGWRLLNLCNDRPCLGKAQDSSLSDCEGCPHVPVHASPGVHPAMLQATRARHRWYMIQRCCCVSIVTVRKPHAGILRGPVPRPPTFCNAEQLSATSACCFWPCCCCSARPAHTSLSLARLLSVLPASLATSAAAAAAAEARLSLRLFSVALRAFISCRRCWPSFSCSRSRDSWGQHRSGRITSNSENECTIQSKLALKGASITTSQSWTQL